MSDTQTDESRGLFVVRYNYSDDTKARERALPEHESFLRRLEGNGDLALAGPLVEEPGVHALLILRAASTEGALELLADDPMLTANILESREISGFIAAFGAL